MLIQTYQAYWPIQFQQITNILSAALSPHHESIAHVGSTAVPGLAAKPIIDIDIVYKNQSDFIAIKSALEHLGYYHNGNQGIEDREVFKRKTNGQDPVLDKISHHLYACSLTSPELNRHLLFRDFLIANPVAREKYQTLKFQIAEAADQDRKRYAHLKEQGARELIESFLTLARES